MTIRHHPNETTLISYAAGALPVAIAGLVACHATICPECRAKVRRLKIVGALLLETIDAEPPPEAEVTRAISRFVQSTSSPCHEPTARPIRCCPPLWRIISA